MILYEATAREFIESVDANQIIPAIERAFRSKLGRGIPPNERSAYTNSLPQMERVIRRANVADDCGVLIEYKIPLTNLRIDFVIAGEDADGNKNFVIVELKQWTSATEAEGNGLVETYTGHGNRIVSHPSYQAQGYAQFMADFNEPIATGLVSVYSCAYLHNYAVTSPEPLLKAQYQKVIEQVPIYFRDDQSKLEDYLAKYVKYGKGKDILYQVESGKIKPSKKLVDHVATMFDGNSEYVLIDEQRVAFERARVIANKQGQKSVVIINGGPGTGKSVVSVNLLSALLKDGLNTVFVAPNSSFRDTLVKRLVQEHPPARVKHLFKGSGGFYDSKENEFEVMIVDEAHRLKKRGAYMYKGDNQVEDIVKAAHTAIFFVDDDQAVRPEDIGSTAEIERAAKLHGAAVYQMQLNAQFRCAGAEGYINWLNDVLHIKQTANYDGWEQHDFEFKIFENPNDMRRAINAKSGEGYTARVLAGYAWNWTPATSGNANADVDDVEIPQFDFSMPWNSRKVGTTWAIDPSGLNQVGCIHTSQGLEFDYVGVIVGEDLSINLGTLEFSTNTTNTKMEMAKRASKIIRRSSIA